MTAQSQPYDGLDFSPDELQGVMKAYYDDLCKFMITPEFQTVYNELMSLPPKQRPAYVMDVLLDPEELARRGVSVPPGILIQTSAFGDRRPTLFVLKKFLPEKFHKAWENVNWTFNNEFEEADVPVDPENSWRRPLRVDVQNAMLTSGDDLQSVPNNKMELLHSNG